MFTVGWETAPLYESEVCMKAVVKVDIVDGKCVVIYSDGSEQELYEYPSDEGGGGGAVLGTKNITSNGSYTARNDGYDGFSKVTVNVPTGITPTGTKQISIITNGTSIEDVTNYANAEINVNVPAVTGYDINDIAEGTAPSGNIVLNTAETLYNYAFYHRTAITGISAPNCNTIKAYGLSGCSGLSNVSFPKLTSLNDNAFEGCSGLTSIALPLLSSRTYANCFKDCTSLETVDLGLTTQVYNQTFKSCRSLRNLIIRRTASIASLYNFNEVTLGGIYTNPTLSTIYVPQSLLSAYKEATNWVTGFNAGLTFTAIEGSYYETHYGDGTPIA